MRTHVILPEDLVKEVDGLVGKRKRSKFLAEAADEKIRRLKLEKAVKETAGVLKGAPLPEWETPKKTYDWVRKLRRLDENRFEKIGKRRDKVPS